MFATSDSKNAYRVFKEIYFLNYFMYSFIAVSLLCLFNPFIELWVGSEYLFEFEVVCIIVINFYITGMRKSVLTFREASGLFYKDRWKAVFEAIINLVASIILAIYFGVFGVFLGTFISSVTVCVWVEPLILYKYGFKEKLIEYFKLYFMFAIVTVLSCALTYYLCSFITFGRWISLFVKAFICLIVPNTINIILFRNTDSYQYFKNLIKKIIKKIRRKK